MTAPQLSHVQSAAVSPDTTPLQEDNMEVNFPTTTLGFNSLPPEIRNRIYRMLFVGNPVELIFRANNSRSAALLATCKEIEREGSSILYGENVFCFRPRFYNIQGNLTAYEVNTFFKLPIHLPRLTIPGCAEFLRDDWPQEYQHASRYRNQL